MSAGLITQEEPVVVHAHAHAPAPVQVEGAQPWVAGGWSDYLELTKPRIAVLELVTVALSAFTARWMLPDAALLAWLLSGTALVAAGASAWNQWLEIGTDLRMRRTAERPLPAGRLTPRQVATFGFVTTVAGVALLASQVNPLTALFGFATWFLYVVVYTPMKRYTSLNTVVGAVAGAMPVLMGWAAVDGPMNLSAASLFMIVFLWQFPHFMAIAWMYKDDYALGGYRVLPVVDPTGRKTARSILVWSVALVPVSIAPVILMKPIPAGVFGVLAAAMGVGFLLLSIKLAKTLARPDARRMFIASIIHLPLLLVLLVVCCAVSALI